MPASAIDGYVTCLARNLVVSLLIDNVSGCVRCGKKQRIAPLVHQMTDLFELSTSR
ncbi:hypothetical protein ACP4OV_006816 [Aristida adscensionis]